ncbi:MAG: FecR domain-containing protein [Rhodothalassiaceae bacterium]
MSERTREKALEEATRWFARLRRDHVSDSERAAFEAWRAENLAHRRAYDEISGLWSMMDGLEPQPRPLHCRQPGRVPRLAGALVASLLLIVTALYVAGSAFDIGPWGLPHYRTTLGEQRTVTLRDGSRVHLNTQTDMTVAFYDVERHVRLRSGEALFEVAPDPDRPFIVDAGAGRVHVTGTQFNIRLDGEAAAVTVIEGHVDVSRRLDDHGPSAQLVAGEGVLVDAAGVSQVAAVDIASVTAWREGRLVFRGTPLRRVVADLNRYFVPEIRIGDPSLADLRLTAVIRLDDRNAILEALEATLPVDVVTLPNGLSVLTERRKSGSS